MIPKLRRAVFLDRDGVLNRALVVEGRPHPPAGLEDLEILPGVLEALSQLRAAGFLLIAVTNQPDVARGIQRREVVEATNSALRAALPLDDLLVCYHDGADACRCRKPRPGLLVEAAARHGIDLAASFMVGDRWNDVEAGRRAGCITVFVDHGYGERGPDQPAVRRVGSLPEAAAWILARPSMQGLPRSLGGLAVKIFADGADKAGMLEMYRHPLVKGFTTNPTLMRKAQVADYQAFAAEIIRAIPDRPISFEVFSDDLPEMRRQALKIAGWGPNVHVKIPVTTTRGESSAELAHDLGHAGVRLNVTALMSLDQVATIGAALAGGAPAFVSVFAGRIADTGRDPVPLMAAAVDLLRPYPNVELIWASPRELLNLFQADAVGCHVITMTNDLLARLDLIGKDLHEFSLDTVRMFRSDALKAGYRL